MVRKQQSPGTGIIDTDLDAWRERAIHQRINKLSVRWGGPGAPFHFVGELWGGMKGYGLLLEDDAELRMGPNPNIFIYSEHLKGVHEAGAVFPEYGSTYEGYKVIGYNTERVLAPYDRYGNPCDFKLHRRSATIAEEDIGVAFGKAGDFIRVAEPMLDRASAAALGLSPEEYARNFWELAIIQADVYNGFLENWDWVDRSQGANAFGFDPPID